MKEHLTKTHIPFFLSLIIFMLTLLIANQGSETTVWANDLQTPTEDSFVYLPSIFKPIPIPSSVHLIPFATGFTSDAIVDIANAGDARLFALQRNGVVRIVQSDGSIMSTPFLDIRSLVGRISANWELGALGLVFHPNYPATPYVYVSYTHEDQYRITLDRYTVNPTNPNVADPATLVRVLQIKKTGEDNPNVPVSPVHNGGDLSFGPDGYLYMGTGDGGPDPHFGSTVPHDPADHGQRTDVLLGKMLRIDVDPTRGLPPQCNLHADVDGNYSIPPDNPYAGVEGCDEIWATGLRNPWRFSFDAETDDLYIADVGEWIFEEIDFEPSGFAGGANYGWRCFEGSYDQTIDHPIYADRCEPASVYDFPVHEYHHNIGACSITGGFVYRGQRYPDLQGYYIFSDFCSGHVWLLRQMKGAWQSTEVGFKPFISTFGEGADGELYAGNYVGLLPSGTTPTLYRVEVP